MKEHPIWVEINLSNLAHNVGEVRRLVGRDTEMAAVVKANAYGHGLVEAARTFLDAGADSLAVARVGEGVKLRRAGVDAEILVMSFTPPAQYEAALDRKLVLTVYDPDLAAQLSEIAGRRGEAARVHLKVDTGMGRLGVPADRDLYRRIVSIAFLPHLEVEGIYTHFANADQVDKRHAQHQLVQFIEVTCSLGQDGVDIPLLHAANSAAIIDIPESRLNMVRPGIMLYGLYPSETVDKKQVRLRPAMSLKAQVGFVKRVPAGCTVSYGSTYVTPSPTVLATVPCGYADGYNRRLSNRGEVLIRGRRAPVVGRVCMDQFVVDVGHIPDVAVGDEVVLFGRQDEAELPVEEIANVIGTINYEVVSNVAARVPRVYLRD
ncbi:MAG: alanine racemase [Candidatus Desulforudis sp.]|nr:alanine racemase [Desulforudis sp.]